MVIFDRKVAFLDSFARFSHFICPVDESVSRRRYKHGFRTGLVDLIVDSESKVARTQVFGLLSYLLTHICVAGVGFGTLRITNVLFVAILLHGGERLVVGLDPRVANLNLMNI